VTREADGRATVHFVSGRSRAGEMEAVRARWIVGADGALSKVARQELPDAAAKGAHVFAYHEIVKSPGRDSEAFGHARADVYYDGRLSPDFYAWVFPHGDVTSIGTGSMQQGFKLRDAVATLREEMGFTDVETVRCEGAPIPLKPLPRWDNGRDVVLAGDAAGVVAPASGEGIFYAMTGGRRAAEAVARAQLSGDARVLKEARRRFMREHGQVFWVLDIMQRFWYSNDNRRERFVAICRDPDVQSLTFEAYMRKRLIRARPLAHLRIFMKNLGHLAGVLPA
ncbi:MAG: FAD-dependent monooxygenase, partial [Gemmatimonadetes bacterium]|nr:FAD-dependent monooxygenase [Gemmatimonadota bacterium]